MSLKAFHLVFCTALTLLALAGSIWKFRAYADSHAGSDFAWGAAALLVAGAVVVYGNYFLKKLKNVSFL